MLTARANAILAALIVSALATSAGCSGGDEASPDYHGSDGEEADDVGSTSSALVASDPVSKAVAQSCSTTAVKGLATQLVAEIQCLKPGSMKRIDGTPGLALGSAVFPWLQTPAANALVSAQKARGATMSINSGLRTLPQQFLLYRWYQGGRCGIGLAARPGSSNHESAIAVDIGDNGGWRTAMANKKFRWLGANDPVHFDFTGGGTIDMRGLSVRAFQRLWNRNHPEDTIAEDGDYGPSTETRLAKAPVGGFAKGAQCDDPDGGPPSMMDPGASPEDVPVVPDAPEPEADADNDGTETPARTDLDAGPDAGGGCALTPSMRSAWPSAFAILVTASFAFSARRRRSARATRSAR